ncbi:MAG: tyrosine-type recombinase/integrase [Sphingobium sp.]
MARTVIDARLTKREQRLRLSVRKEPYWMTLNEGEHLGYYHGARTSKWVARFRAPGKGSAYQHVTLGEADDHSDADGEAVLNFRQAQDAARHWHLTLHRNDGKRLGAYTVSQVLNEYLEGFQGKDLANTRRRIEAIIRPTLGTQEVTALTAPAITRWLNALASSPARLRSGREAEQNYRETADTDEARRRRRASANRVLTILKAALNVAYRAGKVSTDDAWRRVRPFPKAEAPKLRYLSDSESRILVNSCDANFRPMVQAALLTGARYAELASLEVRDFDLHSHTVWLRETKAGVARAVYLEEEGVRLFDQLTFGKQKGDLIFPRPDGKRWGPSQQARPLAAACKAGNLAPTGFHDLRRTYGARLALKGVPMAVIAEALGHADERITRRHYAHLSKSYVAEMVRAGMQGMGIVEQQNISRLEQRHA